MQSAQTYLTLSPDCSLRLLEKPCIYDRARDELYELDNEASRFVQTLPLPAEADEVEKIDTEFLYYCLDEGIFSLELRPARQKKSAQGPTPSLRYLLLHITTRCNLKCSHCFLGDAEPRDLSFEQILQAMEEFDRLQGLRLLVSGGEPLLHPQFWQINELFGKYSFRTVILSNGTTFQEREAPSRLRAHEVQVSLDGVGPSHDALRGPGAYEKTMAGISNLVSAGIDVSVASMIHADNVGDFDEMETMIRKLGVKEWNIDVPSRSGRWERSEREGVAPADIAAIFKRSFGGGVHDSGETDLACGAHLCAVMADGEICKCGFYAHLPSGTIDGGLAEAWRAIPRIKLAELKCDCRVVDQCRGGCRYRAEVAGDRYGKDAVMCAANGLPY